MCVCEKEGEKRRGFTVKLLVPGPWQLIIKEAGPEVDIANMLQSNQVFPKLDLLSSLKKEKTKQTVKMKLSTIIIFHSSWGHIPN